VRLRRRAVAVITACAAALVVLPVAHAATQQQRFFRGALLDDAKTGRDVRAILRDNSGYVNDRVKFSDLTGDSRADAVVMVSTGGAAGNVAVYVFSTEGLAKTADLRAIYRGEGLYRAQASVPSTGLLVIRTPKYQPGSGLCGPVKIVERRLRWSKSSKRFRVTSTRELDPPS
jgi:hypothetical protein